MAARPSSMPAALRMFPWPHPWYGSAHVLKLYCCFEKTRPLPHAVPGADHDLVPRRVEPRAALAWRWRTVLPRRSRPRPRLGFRSRRGLGDSAAKYARKSGAMPLGGGATQQSGRAPPPPPPPLLPPPALGFSRIAVSEIEALHIIAGLVESGWAVVQSDSAFAPGSPRTC
jgi:hypothetical protein